MNCGPHNVKKAGLLALVLKRSFSRTDIGLRIMQGSQSTRPPKNWVNTSCFAICLLGLSLSFFSTRQMLVDPNSQCLLWKK